MLSAPSLISLRFSKRHSRPDRRFRPNLEGLGARLCPSTTTDPFLPPPETETSEPVQTIVLEPGTPEYDAYMNTAADNTTDPNSTGFPEPGTPEYDAYMAAMAGYGTEPEPTESTSTGYLEPGTAEYDAYMNSAGDATQPPTETASMDSGGTGYMYGQSSHTINLQIEMLQGQTVRLYGTVTGGTGPYFLSFYGAASGSSFTDGSGNFSVELEASYLGTIYGVALNFMGIPSNTGIVEATSAVPVIETFSGVQETGNLWTFSGTVADESPADAIVYFGGILSGHMATVQADGTFTLCVTLEEGGLATAMAMDVWWQMSNNAEFLVISA